MLVDAKKVPQKLCLKKPIKIKNSPTKLLVNGKLMLAKENTKKKKPSHGYT
jgi:hypothetical protein